MNLEEVSLKRRLEVRSSLNGSAWMTTIEGLSVNEKNVARGGRRALF